MSYRDPEKQREANRKWKEKNWEYQKRYVKQWKMDNKDRLRKKSKEYYKNNINKFRNLALTRQYNLSLEEYENLLIEQKNVCAICKEPETIKYNNKIKCLAVDHCHITQRIRGLLCARCNTCIGKAEDSIEMLQSMIDYLNRR